jgi:hypothetical protein
MDDGDLVGLTELHDVCHRCTEASLVHHALVLGVVASPSDGSGVAVPDAERLDALFQTSKFVCPNWKSTMLLAKVGVMSGAE